MATHVEAAWVFGEGKGEGADVQMLRDIRPIIIVAAVVVIIMITAIVVATGLIVGLRGIKKMDDYIILNLQYIWIIVSFISV